jgi:hypothetical protein
MWCYTAALMDAPALPTCPALQLTGLYDSRQCQLQPVHIDMALTR